MQALWGQSLTDRQLYEPHTNGISVITLTSGGLCLTPQLTFKLVILHFIPSEAGDYQDAYSSHKSDGCRHEDSDVDSSGDWGREEVPVGTLRQACQGVVVAVEILLTRECAVFLVGA